MSLHTVPVNTKRLNACSISQVLGTRRLMHINHEDFEKVTVILLFHTSFVFVASVCDSDYSSVEAKLCYFVFFSDHGFLL